jgi:AcrR family transcriptional regulator
MRKSGQDGPGAKTQGRPPGSTGEQGRDRLIEKARDAMRLRPKMDLQRREIAEHAGVTPALVSYYFPDRTDLLELAAQPIIDSYVAGVRAILCHRDALETKLQRLIVLFLTFNSEQGFILDHFVEISQTRATSIETEALRTVGDALTEFVEHSIAAGILPGSDPSLVQAALWGICRDVGRGRDTDLFRVNPNLVEDPETLARQILNLFST